MLPIWIFCYMLFFAFADLFCVFCVWHVSVVMFRFTASNFMMSLLVYVVFSASVAVLCFPLSVFAIAVYVLCFSFCFGSLFSHFASLFRASCPFVCLWSVWLCCVVAFLVVRCVLSCLHLSFSRFLFYAVCWASRYQLAVSALSLGLWVLSVVFIAACFVVSGCVMCVLMSF